MDLKITAVCADGETASPFNLTLPNGEVLNFDDKFGTFIVPQDAFNAKTIDSDPLES